MTTPLQIVNLLKEASAAYYNGGELMMDDDTYDGLIERLKQLDPKNPYLEEVGAPVQAASQLPYPMPSLDKIKPGEDILKRFLANSTGFVMSEKLDGLSALWLPTKQQLLLRGDGLFGQDVSHLALLGIQGLSKNCPADTAVRGELILPRSEGIALARSWVNGQVHQKTPSTTEISKIHFVAYAAVDPQHAFKRSQQFQMMQSYGFELPWFSVVPSLTEAALSDSLQERRAKSIYDTDGIVVALNTVPKSESTEAKAKNPKDCVAFKMALADQSAETTVREVLWSPSAQGYLVPRLRFDPVKIGSATIEFCTGHNARTIATHKIGPGAKIIIRRSGDVIPKLDRVLLTATPSFPPTNTWAWDGDTDTAAHIKVVGVTDEMISAKLHYFLKTLEIPGAGPATANALVAAGLTGPAAVWNASPEKLSSTLGPKTGAALYANLRTVLKKVSEMQLMHASSMMPRGVGDTKLASIFAVQADPRLWGALHPSQLAGWTSESFNGFLKEFPSYVAWRTKEIGWIPYPILRSTTIEIPLNHGETICMSGFRDASLQEKAVEKGHIFVPNLTSKVTLLLIPDGPTKESEKTKKASTNNIRIITRNQFVTQYLS